jgi:dephospho-CoA kinase
MKIIGITGGVGSGKSEILNILKNDYQAKVIQSDHVAHELMVPGAKSYDAIVQAFGMKTKRSIVRYLERSCFMMKQNFHY